MKRYQIFAKTHPQHFVKAHDPQDAVKKWLDVMAYETIEEAAREYFCGTEDFSAVEVSFGLSEWLE